MRDVSMTIFGIAVILCALAGGIQSRQIHELKSRIACLEDGLEYVSDDFCYDPEHPAFKDVN